MVRWWRTGARRRSAMIRPMWPRNGASASSSTRACRRPATARKRSSTSRSTSAGSGAFPITSSTNMGGGFNAAVMNGYKNLWGDTLIFVEPESEHSAATFCEGFAAAGGRVTNFTSGQGLVLMKEVLYTISGKRLPVVMNIGARR